VEQVLAATEDNPQAEMLAALAAHHLLMLATAQTALAAAEGGRVFQRPVEGATAARFQHGHLAGLFTAPARAAVEAVKQEHHQQQPLAATEARMVVAAAQQGN
jgi:hypothetical protein